MSLTLKETSNFVNMPEGTYAARCYQVIDIGTQKIEYPYKSGNFKYQEKLILSFETPDIKMEDGKPFIIHQEYTASLNEKARLRGHLESWRGRAFTPEELRQFYIGDVLGKACVISVIHKTSSTGKTNAKVTNISALMSGMTVPEATNPLLKWEVGSDLSVLPEWIKNKALASLELSGEQTEGNFQTIQQTHGSTPMSENPGEGLTSADAGYPPAGDFSDDIPF